MTKSQLHSPIRVGVIAVLLATGLTDYPATPLQTNTSSTQQAPPEVSFERGFAPIVGKIRPSVVNIASSRTVRSRAEDDLLFSDPFLNELFGEQYPVPRERREHSLGSGVIVSNAGYVMTNNHVVEQATEIRVSLFDKREFTARIVGTDPKTDIALLKVDADDLVPVPFGDSSEVEVGEFILAVGNPFGVGQTVTLGIVSATERGGLGIEAYEDFIQTDAAINPGNSGGAMVNARGQLIGINTAIVSGGAEGLGFAVPINLAQQVMFQILKQGRVIRGWLGAQAQTLTPQMMQAFGLTGSPRGALVTDVMAGSPAARSGLTKGDIILAIDGRPLEDSRSLSLKISMMAPGTVIQMKVFRDGRERELTATLVELREKPAPVQPAGRESFGPRFGLWAEPLTGEILHDLELPPDTHGVIITDVTSGSAAEAAGVRFGDIIQEVNRKRVTNMDEYLNAIQNADTMVMLLINRLGDHAYVVLEGPKEPAR
jgi:serine protease Do